MDISENELRINSYYKLKRSVTIDENIFKLSMADIKGNVNICDKIEAVPLTKEILLRFGFDRGSDIIGECYFINESENDFVIYLEADDFCYYDGMTMIVKNYVHEIQNIYSSLYLKELILK